MENMASVKTEDKKTTCIMKPFLKYFSYGGSQFHKFLKKLMFSCPVRSLL